MSRPVASSPSLPPIIGFAIAVAILYFARELFIPLAFAVLLSFLLGPAVKQLGRWHIPRIPSAVLVLLITSSVVAVVGWFVTVELIQTAESLPAYTDNVRRKIEALEGGSRGFSRVMSSLAELGHQMESASTPQPKPGHLLSGKPEAPAANVLPVRIVQDYTMVQMVRDYAGEFLRPMGTVGLILVFSVFMLIDREGLRNRLLRLMGQGQLQATTKAMDDAGHRVSRYILMQFAVNACFGAIISAGLYFMGVPSYLLWGVLGMFLRFLPYVGPVIAWMLPFLLSLAEKEGWTIPLSVTALFFFTEMIIGNLVEPLLYGVHTGLSAVAIVVSAVFWTVLWGPVGLVLATPMTVCLSVLGRYSPQLEFLNIALGDEPVLTPAAIFYQRLLALDQQEALEVLDSLGKGRPLMEIFDDIVIPALAMAERDRQTGQLDKRREEFIVQSINEFVTELCEADAVPVAKRETRKTRVFFFPAFGAADEIAAAMCAHFLTQQGFPSITFPVTESPGQLVRALGVQDDDVVLISAVPPFAVGHARRVSKDLLEAGIQSVLVAGIWGYSAEPGSVRPLRLQKSLSAAIAPTLRNAVEQVRNVERGVRPV